MYLHAKMHNLDHLPKALIVQEYLDLKEILYLDRSYEIQQHQFYIDRLFRILN